MARLIVSVTVLSILVTSCLPQFLPVSLTVSSNGNGIPAKNNHLLPTSPPPTSTPHPMKPLPSEKFQFHEQLDKNYEIYWNFNETHVVFEFHVKTNGYIGFGISSNGAMAPSDVVIAWVKDGVTHFSDRHAQGHYLPAVDSHQDWQLISGSESGQFTTIKTVRKLETCDPQDVPILEGTTRVIYSYHPDDPDSDTAIPYHGGGNRGSKSILILNPPTSDAKKIPLSDDVISFDFLNNNYSVPARDTAYHCTTWKLPPLGGKHHVIRYEPIIEKGHEKLVHHIVIYYCSYALDDTAVGLSYDCYHTQNPKGVDYRCTHVFLAWAIGGQAFNYPPHVGFSLGAQGDPGYFKMETHYDNPDMRPDFVDNSGIRLFLSPHLRQHDAGMLEVGVNVDAYQVIPPYEKSFLSSGHCQQQCLSQALGDQEIHVFANLLHAHLMGVKLRTRHFRNGVELPPIMEDNNYDFDFQEQRFLKEERILKKGDSLITECEYDSSQRTAVSYGGLSSREEMCLAFLVYYPKISLTTCVSRLEYKFPSPNSKRNVFEMIRSMDFSQTAVRQSFRDVIQVSDLTNLCWGDGAYYQFNMQVTPAPNITNIFHKPAVCHV